MARELDCTDFENELAEAALAFAELPGHKDLDAVVRSINKVDWGDGHQFTREQVRDAVLSTVHARDKAALSDGARQLAAIKGEAKTDKRLREKIERYEGILKGINPEEPLTARQQREVSEVIAGLRAEANRKRMLAGRKEKIDRLTERLADFRSRKVGMLNRSGGLEPGDFPARKPDRFATDDELLRMELKRRELNREVNKEIQRLRPDPWKFRLGMNAFNSLRTSVASLDGPPIFRQGGFIFWNTVGRVLLGDVKGIQRSGRNLKDALSAWKDTNALALDKSIDARPNAANYQRSGLRLSRLEGGGEEEFIGDLVKRIPGFGHLIRRSERFYTTFLDQMRVDAWDAMAATLAKNSAPTLDEMKVISNFINNATGKGPRLGTGPAIEAIKGAFFAPEYVLSRFKMIQGIASPQAAFGVMHPQNGAKTISPRLAKEIRREYVRYLIGMGTFLGLAGLVADDYETDARSSDFLKMRFGDTTVDFGAGLQQPLVLMSRIITGESKSASSGRVSKLRGPEKRYGGQDAGDVLGRFVRSKLSPGAGLLADVFKGSDFLGRPIDADAQTAGRVGVSMLPISGQFMVEHFKEDEVPRPLWPFIFEMHGANVQTFKRRSG